MGDRVWTISNVLSVLRIALIVPIVLLLLSESSGAHQWAVVLMVIAVFTDWFDGYLARRYGEETELGRILDPLADKIGTGAIVIVLAIQGVVPLWFVAIALGRDLLILLGGLILKMRKCIVLPSVQAGKVAVAFVAIYIIVTVLNLEGFAMIELLLLTASTLMLFVSFIVYLRRFFRELSAVRTT